MLFKSPEEQLKNFTEKYCKSKSINDIPVSELRKWGKITEETGGQYVGKYMKPYLWADSINSLRTALDILEKYTPVSLSSNNDFQSTLSATTEAILKKRRGDYEIKHGTLDLNKKQKKKNP